MRADGTVIEPFYVLEQMPWVSILAVTPHREVIMVREYRHGAGVVGLGLPGGGAAAGEAPAGAAQRELLEETGYEPGDLVELSWTWANWANQTNKVHHYLATGCRAIRAPSPDPTEQLEVELVPLANLLGGDPVLRQSYHLVTIALARPHLGAD
ncbi:NUDIX hydrolase [Microlunatus parietis]|uniref:8-oxo-dGTP pyrophosphatase MutT (NUDIX family) n=1 Tax=Microlunatus parietis TaxID=682979 RepID=A0A7Y9ID98_9ACTN|nr:NUDIX domain-containing protein [Microlunatus parietis]NYE74587.1 8-oxo-dGTP pyrophosphatase MutT (NUDIX family) [Microlunatus parietis]